MTPTQSMGLSGELRSRFARVQRIGFILGASSLSLAFLFSFHSAKSHVHFFQSYLFAFVFWLSIPLGCQAILMLHHLTGGWWGYPIRRLLEAGTRTFAVMAILFLPVLAGMKELYAWARPADVAADHLLEYKHPYLNPEFCYRTRDYLFRDLDWTRLFIQQVVARAGRNGRSCDRRTFRSAERSRIDSLGTRDYVRIDRLGDVARAALVFDDLRNAFHDRRGARRRCRS